MPSFKYINGQRVQMSPQEEAAFEASKAPSAAEIIRELDSKLTDYLDQKAQERRYDNRITCALRAAIPGRFKNEGTAFAVWMDACNAYAYDVMQAVLAGQRPVPTWEELKSELPVLEWP